VIAEALARAVLEAARARGVTLVTAESCTGGLVAAALTDIPGSSAVFDRGFVTYSYTSKTALLGVPEALIAEHGAVSEPVARAMAEGALGRSRADIALAVTGFAGPTGGKGEEGLVHFACAGRGQPTAHRRARYGSIGRGGVRIECLKAATGMIGEMLDRAGAR
jgi:nicotinamide-nucleotide amidase